MAAHGIAQLIPDQRLDAHVDGHIDTETLIRRAGKGLRRVMGTLPAEDFAGRMVPRDRSGITGLRPSVYLAHPFLVLT
jgi:hypothetical protein